jgi:hypothetical protein
MSSEWLSRICRFFCKFHMNISWYVFLSAPAGGGYLLYLHISVQNLETKGWQVSIHGIQGILGPEIILRN